MKRKVIAIAMAVMLCAGLLPASVLATEQDASETQMCAEVSESAEDVSDETDMSAATDAGPEYAEKAANPAAQGEIPCAGKQQKETKEMSAISEEDGSDESYRDGAVLKEYGTDGSDAAGQMDSEEKETDDPCAVVRKNSAEDGSVPDGQENQKEGLEEYSGPEEADANDILLLDATQVIEGSGSVAIYERDSASDTPEYILKVTDAPTNTEISLDSPHIRITDQNGNEVEGIALSGNLTYVTDAGEEIPVSFLMLDEDAGEDEYILTPYGESGETLDLTGGRLVITVPDSVNAAYIWKIQTDTLCYLDENGNYRTEITEAVIASEPILCDLETYTEGQTADLTEFAGVSDGDFYYGFVNGLFDLTSCTQAVVQEGKLLPLNESGDPVSDVSIYLAYDELYSFDVTVNDAVNEHEEDNGDIYLWFGDTFYIDQYHSQGVYLTGYSNNAAETADCGIWPMLGRTREALIHDGTYGFDHWMGQDLTTWEKVKAYDGVTGNDITKSASGKDSGDKNYGIVGPFSFADGETKVTQSTVRVTGRIGDEFTASEVFGTDEVYMVREDSDYHDEWYNLGSHASDNGKRAWFYWISDFYILNNHQDMLEYVKISEVDGEVRLIADEIGEEGDGELLDVWDLTGIYTDRGSAVKIYMAEHEDELTELGVGFSEYLGWLDHIQLRLFTTVETIINGVEYNGTMSLMTRSYTPTITYDLTSTDIDGEEKTYSGSETVTKQNEQECNPVEFSNFYVNPEEAFEEERIQITLDLGFNGTLTGEDGSTIVYTNDNPFIYHATLTSEQLWEAYDYCPNNTGYDFAVNLSDAIKTYAEDSLLLYKVWEDDDNAYGTRDNITAVPVYLERSEKGETWEDVVDESGAKQAFVIHGSADSSIWSLPLTGGDLDLTYELDGGDTEEYLFRISGEQDSHGILGNGEYTYSVSSGSGETLSLTVTNTLQAYPIEIAGEKQWVDEKGEFLEGSVIPGKAYIALYEDGRFYDVQIVTEEDGWKFSFTNLTQQTGEDAVVYTLAELDEAGTRVGDGGSVVLDGSAYQVGIAEEEEGYVVKNILTETSVSDSEEERKASGQSLSEQKVSDPDASDPKISDPVSLDSDNMTELDEKELVAENDDSDVTDGLGDVSDLPEGQISDDSGSVGEGNTDSVSAPKTDDTSRLCLWFTLVIAAAALMIAVLAVQSKKSKVCK